MNARSSTLATAGVAILVSPASVAGTAALLQWRAEDGGNGHWYQRIDSPTELNWTDAKVAAQSQGGYLVTLNAADEQAWVYNNLVLGFPYCETAWWTVDRGIWIGLYQDPGSPGYSEPAGGWRWVTGEQFSFSHWHPGEPNNTSVENYAGMFYEANGTWNDEANNAGNECYKAYVVEWSADCNGDGIVDFGQIRAGELADDNGNNIPDCCEQGTFCEPCLADLDDSGVVNSVDLAIILAAWGTNGGKYPQADIDGSGTVDATDLSQVLAGWGPCPQ
jgi:hypothetical protein